MIDLGNELRYYFGTKAVAEGQKRNALGEYDLNPIGVVLGGLTQENMASAGAQRDYNSPEGLELRQKAADVGKPLTAQDFLDSKSKIAAKTRISDAKKVKDREDQKLTPQYKLFEAQLAELRANSANRTAQLTAETKLANRQQDFLEQLETSKLADKEADRTQNLRILQMQQEADQARYNQNLELYREDQKKDQVNNLVAGLVALGAAFAV